MRQNILVLEFQLRKHLLVRLHVEIFAICLRIQLESEWRKINTRRGESEKEAWLSAEEVNKFDRGLGNLRCSHSISKFFRAALKFKKGS